MTSNAGFEELDHTADWALKVWAPALPDLLKTAAEGMYALSEIRLDETGARTTTLKIEALDFETLLVEFLTELLFFAELGEGAARMALQLDDFSLSGRLELAPIRSQKKEIKAVTFHNLKIESVAGGFETVLVFDV